MGRPNLGVGKPRFRWKLRWGGAERHENKWLMQLGFDARLQVTRQSTILRLRRPWCPRQTWTRSGARHLGLEQHRNPQ